MLSKTTPIVASVLIAFASWAGLAGAQETSSAPPPSSSETYSPPPSSSTYTPQPSETYSSSSYTANPSSSSPTTYSDPYSQPYSSQPYSSQPYSSQPPPPPPNCEPGSYCPPPPCPPEGCQPYSGDGYHPPPCPPEGCQPYSGDGYRPPPCPPEGCQPYGGGGYDQGGYSQGGYPQGDYNQDGYHQGDCPPDAACGNSGPGGPGSYGQPYNGCPPRDKYCRPPENTGQWDQGGYEQDACFQKMDEKRGEIEGVFRSIPDRLRKEVFEAMGRAKAEFARTNPDREEWAAFHEEWHSKAKAAYDAINQEAVSQLASILGECADRFPPPQFPEFQMGGGPGDRGPGGPGFEGGERRYQEFDGRADELRRECEKRVWEYIGPPPHEEEAYEQWKASNPEPPSQDAQRKAQEVWRECEKKIRAEFEQEHGDYEGEDDFGSFGSFQMYYDEDKGRIIVEGKHLSMEGNEEAQMIESLTCRGAKFADRLFVNGLLEEFSPEQTSQGTALQVYDSDRARVLALHDNPRCALNIAATTLVPSVTLDLSDYLDCSKNEAGDLECTDGEITALVLLHGADLELGAGNELTVVGKATFLVQGDWAKNDKLGDSYDRALKSKNLGAEVVIGADGDDLEVDSTSYGDLEIEVEGETDEVSAYIESEDGEGKTVALAFDGDTFSTDNLAVDIVGIDDEGEEEEICQKEAEDLDDVLDPHDDGDCAEYWIIEDKNGYHVLASFAHFSMKKVTVSSSGASDSVTPGFDAAIALTVLGLVAIVAGVRSRRKE